MVVQQDGVNDPSCIFEGMLGLGLGRPVTNCG